MTYNWHQHTPKEQPELTPAQRFDQRARNGDLEGAKADEEYWAANPSRLVGISDLLAYKPEPALIDGYMPRKGLGQIYGPSYSGKSYAAVDLALSVCAGLDEWMGLPLNLDGPQHVVYIAAEGGLPFRDSVVGWLEAHPGADITRLHVLDGGKGGLLNISAEAGQIEAKTSFGRLVAEVNHVVGDEPIALMILDPQINIMPSVDENSNREMAEVFGQLKAIADASETLMLLVHHTGHTTGRARGASAQFGIMDLVISLEGANGEGQIKFEKVKGAAKPQEPLKFSISSVTIDNGTRTGAYAALAATTSFLSSDDHTELLAFSRKKQIESALASGATSALAIQGASGLSRNVVGPLLRTLETEGKVVNDGSPSRPAWRLA